jgi:hypothetical protein
MSFRRGKKGILNVKQLHSILDEIKVIEMTF